MKKIKIYIALGLFYGSIFALILWLSYLAGTV